MTNHVDRLRSRVATGSGSYRPPRRQRRARRAVAALAVAAFAVTAGGRAEAAVVPLFSSSESQAAADHRPNAATDAGRRQGAIAYSNGSATNKDPYNPSTLTFPGGNTVAKAGIGRTQSTNRAGVTFASGTGVSQNDPTHTQPTSELTMTFRAVWTVMGGSFGPPLTSSFSVPIGVKVNGRGSAEFFCDVHWGGVIDFEQLTDIRSPFTTTRTFGPGTTLTSITATASPFNPSVFGEGDSIVMTGTLRFRVNNDDGPALMEFPTLENFPELATMPELQFEPGMQIDGNEVPEPSGAAAVGAAGVTGLLARRRRQDPAR